MEASDNRSEQNSDELETNHNDSQSNDSAHNVSSTNEVAHIEPTHSDLPTSQKQITPPPAVNSQFHDENEPEGRGENCLTETPAIDAPQNEREEEVEVASQCVNKNELEAQNGEGSHCVETKEVEAQDGENSSSSISNTQCDAEMNDFSQDVKQSQLENSSDVVGEKMDNDDSNRCSKRSLSISLSESDDEDKSPEESLLYSSRHGDIDTVLKILKKKKQGEINVDTDCRGHNKANLGWSPLHLASYFGHTDVVGALLKSRVKVNVQNDTGNTPLHWAAYTGRVDCVMLLLKYNADVNIRNMDKHLAKEVAKTKEIHDLIEAAETCEMKKKEEQFLRCARNGDVDKIIVMLKSSNPPNINCCDSYGNSALHWAAYSGKRRVAVVLLENGIDTKLKNLKGQQALALAKDNQMKQIVDVKPMKELLKSVDRYEGPLLKKGRLRGWKRFWVVVDRGVISLFKTRADATTGSRRKGCKYLDQGRVECSRDEGHVFLVFYADGSQHTFAVDQNLTATLSRQKWENMISNHIAYASQLVVMGGHISDDDDEMGDVLPLGSMQDKLQTAEAHQQVLEKQIQRVTQTINSMASSRESNNRELVLLDIRQQLNCVLTDSQEMCSSLKHCLSIFTQQEHVRKVQLQQEEERSRVLQQALKVLAEEHRDLEQSVGRSLGSPIHMITESDEDDEDDLFYECRENASSGDDAMSRESIKAALLNKSAVGNSPAALSKWNARSILPAEMLTRKDFSVWTFLKQCIGKELSKITMPVIFNEPISFLQRLAEYMEYAAILKKAAESKDPVERLEYVAAFAVSSSAANWDRVGKPFNPLLGETYELNRQDLGYRLMCEQVSHHPPVSAFYVEGPQYMIHGSVHPKLKFWGKSVEAIPKGTVTLQLIEHDEVYTWENVVCCIHNIIVGKLWIEHYGTMEVMNHKTGHKAMLSFKPAGWFGRDLHKVEGYIYDSNRKKQKALYGKWVEGLYSHDIKSYEEWKEKLKANKENGGQGARSQNEATSRLNIEYEKELWVAESRPANADKYYNFTLFSMMLNEMDDKLQETLPPTDSRLRPDIRKLEEGNLDASSAEKHRLEEKQREARKRRKEEGGTWQPKWFSYKRNPQTNKDDWMYDGSYWEGNWQSCPDIF